MGILVLRAGLWSAVGGALATLVLWLRTSPEARSGFQSEIWFGVSCALAFVPILAMELGVAHLLLEVGAAPKRSRPRSDRRRA